MKKILYDERGDGEEICFGIIGVLFFIWVVIWVISFIITLIISIFTQILIVATIVFVVYRVISKQNKIIKWIQPSIHSMTESEISHSVLLNIFVVAPLYNKYSSKNTECLQLETKIKTLFNDIKEKSDLINQNEKQINIMKNSTMSAITINEIDLLLTKNFKENGRKMEFENKLITLKNSLAVKQDELNRITQTAYGFIIKQQKIDGGAGGTVIYENYEDDGTKIY